MEKPNAISSKSSSQGIILAVLAIVLTTGIDQLSKSLALAYLADGGRIVVTPFLDFVLVWNKGVSYGLFATDSAYGPAILIGFSLVVMLFIFRFIMQSDSLLTRISYAIILGGALGNVIDRAVFGAVVDFISLHSFDYYWYVFNIADIWISLGAVALICQMIFQRDPEISEKSEGAKNAEKRDAKQISESD